jgi:cell fate regulator YaaT (PSP1 superfamily)
METIINQGPAIRETVMGVRFQVIGKLYHFDFGAEETIQAGDYVIVETNRGQQMGQVMGFAVRDSVQEYRSILRKATPRDLLLRQHWEAQQDEALELCRGKARQLRSLRAAKVVGAQYNFDGSRLTFLLSAEDKLETASLRNALTPSFAAEVEIRQIGPRDVAKLMGGMGACGEARCCSTFLTDFSPISIKMAKAQGISLNPAEITGMCGRLRCCLVYEYEQYVEARKHLPRRNKKIGTPDGVGKVIDVHPLQDAVTVFIEGEGRRLVKREEIVPLEEYEALLRKAQEPCSKHGDEPCDCGKPVGQRQADLRTEAVSAGPIEAEQEPSSAVSEGSETTADAPETETPGSRPPRRGRRRGGRKRNKPQTPGEPSGAQN